MFTWIWNCDNNLKPQSYFSIKIVPVILYIVLLLQSRRVAVLLLFEERFCFSGKKDTVSGKFTEYDWMFIAFIQSPKWQNGWKVKSVTIKCVCLVWICSSVYPWWWLTRTVLRQWGEIWNYALSSGTLNLYYIFERYTSLCRNLQ